MSDRTCANCQKTALDGERAIVFAGWWCQSCLDQLRTQWQDHFGSHGGWSREGATLFWDDIFNMLGEMERKPRLFDKSTFIQTLEEFDPPEWPAWAIDSLQDERSARTGQK